MKGAFEFTAGLLGVAIVYNLFTGGGLTLMLHLIVLGGVCAMHYLKDE